MANALVDELTLVNPYRLWMATSYDKFGNDHYHAVRCHDCWSHFDAHEKYNIVVYGYPPNNLGDYGIVSDPYIENSSDVPDLFGGAKVMND